MKGTFDTDIVIGTVFSFGERPVVQVVKGENILLRDGYIVSRNRPAHWWYLVSWVRICRALWSMPRGNGHEPAAVELRDGWIVPL